MNNIDDQKRYPLIPRNELRCVWMTAGILSYQLCDREFDCEHCPLDTALRTHFPDRAPKERPGLSSRSSSEEQHRLRSGYLYSRKHCWMKRQDPTSVRIGIEPGLASVLLSPRAIVLPSIGEYVEKDKVCAWIVTEGGTLQVTSPLSGEVWDVNAPLTDRPHDICEHPLDRGWMFELVVREEDLLPSKLLTPENAARVYATDEQKFQKLLRNELESASEAAGMTLADGGQFLESVSVMLGTKKYFLLVREVFS